ncbi:Pentapeptide repeat-containing protein [Spirosomataceae bacterium TFI 002]|nr:Pentapeptide repeat-containing protein [Spirosomataceae bacterium TFI 002]
MKKLFLLLILPFLSFAQNEIGADEIIEMINDGKDVVLADKVILGTLDFTEINNQEKLTGKESPQFKSVVTVRLEFVNCVFEDDLIAFKNIKDKNNQWGETYTADFDQEVSFTSCLFKGDFTAKYSSFQEKAVFEASRFEKEANFKYAKFKEIAGFGNVMFNEAASFKYTKFYSDADFFSNQYSGIADFKYAKFEQRATFKKSAFDNHADFKYANFAENGVFVNVNFGAGVDFKYTKGNIYRD